MVVFPNNHGWFPKLKMISTWDGDWGYHYFRKHSYISPLSRDIPLPNGLNGLYMGVTNQLLTGMILQVSPCHWPWAFSYKSLTPPTSLRSPCLPFTGFQQPADQVLQTFGQEKAKNGITQGFLVLWQGDPPKNGSTPPNFCGFSSSGVLQSHFWYQKFGWSSGVFLKVKKIRMVQTETAANCTVPSIWSSLTAFLRSWVCISKCKCTSFLGPRSSSSIKTRVIT